jgi:hypothetical protein
VLILRYGRLDQCREEDSPTGDTPAICTIGAHTYADVLPSLPRGRDLPRALTCKMARLIARPITIRGKL